MALRPARSRAPRAAVTLASLGVAGALALVSWALTGAPGRGDAGARDAGGSLVRSADEVPAEPDAVAALVGGELAAPAARAAAELDLAAAAGDATAALTGALGDVPGLFDVRALDATSRRPIAGATVLLRRAGHPPIVAVTGDDGRASVAAPFSIGDVSVASASHVDVARAGIDAGREHVLDLAPSGSLAGRVEFKGRAALGAPEVRLWSRERGRGGRADRQVPLEPNGTFRFDDLTPGFVTVALAAEDVPLVHEPSIAVRAGEETFITLHAPAPLRVAGRVVVAGSGVPIADAVVRARPTAQGTPDSVTALGSARATTGLDGAFVLGPLAGGRHTVVAESPWGARSEREVVVSEALTEELELRMWPPVAVEGRVVDEAGRPVPGAIVAAVEGRELRRVDWRGVLEAAPDERSERVLARVSSDGAGRFLFAALPADVRLALVAIDGTGSALREGTAELTVRRGRTAEAPVLVTLRSSRTLTGQVLDEGGFPVGGADVDVEARDAARRLVGSSTRTADDGRFALAADAERDVQVRVRAPGFRPFGANLPLTPVPGGGFAFAQPIVLERELAVDGVVRSEDGNALRARVRLTRYDAAGNEVASASATSDGYGRFQVGGLSAGKWIVAAQAAGHRSLSPPRNDPLGGVAVEIPAAEPLEIALARAPTEPRGAVSGEIVALGTDDAVLGLRFDGLGRGTLLLEGARFRAVGLPVGQARFVVHAPGFESLALPVAEIAADRTTEMGRIELRPATFLVVRVEDAAGQAVRGAEVRLERLSAARSGREGLPRRLALPAVRGGEHHLRTTPRARWRLVVEHPTAGRYRGELDVAGPSQTVTVQLVPR